MMIEITNKCNQLCPICEASVAKRKIISMDIEFGIKIIDSLINDGVETLSFTGGEPTLCWETLVFMLKYCKTRNVPTRLYTNGTTLNREKVAVLERYLDDIIVSLDSMVPETIKLLRGARHNLPKCVENLKILTQSAIRVIVISVCSLVNYHDLIELASELEKYNIASWWIQQFIPKGVGKENVKRFKISDVLFNATIEELRSRSSKKIRSFPVEGIETKRVFVNCEGNFVDYRTGRIIGSVLDEQIRNKVLNSKVYMNIKREL